jgi:hypothetical protein
LSKTRVNIGHHEKVALFARRIGGRVVRGVMRQFRAPSAPWFSLTHYIFILPRRCDLTDDVRPQRSSYTDDDMAAGGPGRLCNRSEERYDLVATEGKR